MSFYREGSETPTRPYSNQTKMTLDMNNYSSKYLSPITNYNKNNIVSNLSISTNNSTSQNYSDKLNFIQNEEYTNQYSNRKNDRFSKTISFAQNTTKINQFRRDLSQLKSEFVAGFDSFHSILAKAKADLYNALTNQSR